MDKPITAEGGLSLNAMTVTIADHTVLFTIRARFSLCVPVITVFLGVEESIATETSIASLDLADRGAHITLSFAIWAIFSEGIPIVTGLACFEKSISTGGLDAGRCPIDEAASEP